MQTPAQRIGLTNKVLDLLDIIFMLLEHIRLSKFPSYFPHFIMTY